MKILEVTVSHRSDDTRIYQKYVRSLLDFGFDVGYIAPDLIIDTEPGLTLLSVKKSRFLWLRLYGLLKKIPEIRKFNPSFIHLHDPELLLISPLFRILGFKVIYDMHENFYKGLDDKPISWISSNFQKLVWRVLEKTILKHIPVVFAELSYANDFNFKIEPIIVQNFPKKSSVKGRFQRKKSRNKVPKFVYLGTISEDRGALKMISCLDSAFGEANYELHFIGDITDPNLETKLTEIFTRSANIIFHGYQSMHNAWEICNSCDVGLAILDARENYLGSYPTKLFEYVICGLPVVTSNFELYQNLIEENNLGFCVDPNNKKQISMALSEIVGEPKYLELAANVGSFRFEGFTWEDEFSKFVRFLRKE